MAREELEAIAERMLGAMQYRLSAAGLASSARLHPAAHAAAAFRQCALDPQRARPRPAAAGQPAVRKGRPRAHARGAHDHRGRGPAREPGVLSEDQGPHLRCRRHARGYRGSASRAFNQRLRASTDSLALERARTMRRLARTSPAARSGWRRIIDSLPLDPAARHVAQSARPRHPPHQVPSTTRSSMREGRVPLRAGIKPLDQRRRGAGVTLAIASTTTRETTSTRCSARISARCARRVLPRHRRGRCRSSAKSRRRTSTVSCCDELGNRQSTASQSRIRTRACRRETRRPFHRDHAERLDPRRGFLRRGSLLSSWDSCARPFLELEYAFTTKRGCRPP